MLEQRSVVVVLWSSRERVQQESRSSFLGFVCTQSEESFSQKTRRHQIKKARKQNKWVWQIERHCSKQERTSKQMHRDKKKERHTSAEEAPTTHVGTVSSKTSSPCTERFVDSSRKSSSSGEPRSTTTSTHEAWDVLSFWHDLELTTLEQRVIEVERLLNSCWFHELYVSIPFGMSGELVT